MLDTVLKDRVGRPILESDGTTSATVRFALYTAIDSNLEEDQRMDPATKLKLAKLSIKLADDKAKLSAGEITTLLERAAKALSVLVYSQVVQALDPKALE